MTFPGKSLVAALIFLNGCASMRAFKEDERLGRYHFNYVIEADAACGLVQAFDDGAQTFVQVMQEAQFNTRRVQAKDGVSDKVLSSKSFGPYLVLSGTSDSLNLEFRPKKRSDACKTANIFLIHSKR